METLYKYVRTNPGSDNESASYVPLTSEEIQNYSGREPVYSRYGAGSDNEGYSTVDMKQWIASNPWSVPGNNLKLDGQNSQWTGNGWRYVADFNYNGVPVVFVPREFIEQGFKEGRKTTYSDKWGQIAEFMKPAVIDRAALSNSPKGFGQDNFWTGGQYYQAPTEGYIMPSEKFNAVIKNFSWVETPEQKRRGGLGGVLQSFGEFVYDMPGPVKMAIAAFVPGGAAFMASFNATQAIKQGKWGAAVVASLPLFVPSPSGQAPAISIPGMENAVGTLSTTLNVSAATAGQILQGAIELAANGGDLKQVLQNRLAAYLGDKAGTFVSQFAKDFPIAGVEKLVKSVTTDSTKALLLNQDVGKAATAAFATEAIPLAFNSVPGYSDWAKQNPKLADALKTTAINTAKTGDLYGSIRLATEQAAVKVIAPLAESALAKEGIKLNDSQRKLLENTLTAAAQGKPLDSAFQAYALNEAGVAVKNQVAKAEGWESDAQKQGAKGQYGSAIKPDDYTARQQGWEDLAAKQAAIKSYGDTITPVGVKERDQVKGIDPTFDAGAYAKLNEVTGDPFQHFLTQGNKAKLPTNYESGADAALKSIGYKASPDEVKQVADLFKKSADPDVALGKFYDEHWVTQAEAAAAAKQAGFDLTPEQLKTFVGQTTGGQNTVLEDVAHAAKIGQTSQQQRTKFVDSQMADVRQAYKDQGYSDAQINAALPAIRNSLSTAIDQKVSQAAAYANQTKTAYGENSKEYAAAQKQLLETQAATGSAGVVKNGNTFETTSGETRSADTPTKADTWMADKTKAPGTVTTNAIQVLDTSPTGYYDKFGKPYLNTQQINSEQQVYDKSGNAYVVGFDAQGNRLVQVDLGYTNPNFPKNPESQVSTLLQIGKSAADKVLPGPLAALFGGQEGAGASAGAGFSLVGRTSAGDSVYDKTGSDFSLITYAAEDKTKAVNKKTGEVYLVPRPEVPPNLPKPTPTTPVIPPPPVAPPPPPVAPTKDPVADAVKAAQKAADEGRISQQEAEKLLEQAGYKYTPDEVLPFTGAYTPEQAQAAVTKYVDPRIVTEAEVRKVYQDLGLTNPTQADITRFTGQRPQSELPGQVSPYLPTASANVTTEQVIALKAAQDAAAAQAAANQQATQTQFGDVNSRIVELMRQGKDYQTATTQAQTELKQGQAQLGTKVGELGTQVGQIGTQVGQLGTTLGGQIAGLGTQLTAAKQQATQAQQQANMGTLFGLLGGFGGQQAAPPAPTPITPANIGYVYDIGGKSIFANPQQEKAFVSPYAEGGTVEDLMKILRG